MRAAIFLVFSAAAAYAYVPFDVPRELLADVNKGSQAVINIIPDSSFLQQKGGSVLSGLDASIKAVHPAEPTTLIHQTLGDALYAAAIAEGADYADVSCVRNFSGCPSGWSAVESGCSAPNGQTIDFSGLTPIEKSSAADQVGGVFPCM